MQQHPVVISGAGPVGLVAALSLAQKGVDVVILEKEDHIPQDLRAGTFHPPTVEMLDTLGVGETLRSRGLRVPEWQVRDRKEGLVAQFDLNLIADLTPYPFRLHVEQHKLSSIVAEALREHSNARVLFSHQCLGYEQDDDGVTVRVQGPGGTEEIRASYLIGADGAHSIVRKTMGTEFEGFTWPERFLVCATRYDLRAEGYTGNAYIADPDEWVAIFIQPHDGPPPIWRIAFPIGPEMDENEVLSMPFVQSKVQGFLSPEREYDIPYKSIYRVHQRVAKEFRDRRVFLAGDAAHVNNPLGGMGLNSGIHDAMNLTEKLAQVMLHGAPDDLLDRYHRQRHTVNVEYVQAITIRNKRLLEERDPKVRKQRLDELRATVADRQAHRQFLINSSMIASVRRANEIQ
ncbi:NAD(P)/FAD-dependent oxidoreductase [Pigmentiphaga sp.]|mgnify:FL=1|jgi:2-polyprenyl-6-methoxyphenol hydroxylase and related FAD-dependent oxidoreductases|uniref:FAD-dependent oxidoreductase n=1 Tax=Pigmentiphaga sp. TaxID=1977564 RepID=UPI0025D3D7B0|nr:NAD(P)/FAD-dependent oxidoreductase [Pigmentiphaga sp.]MBX6318465.1 FAD-dependent monooxygenase [Pigmentiphaga sp.]